MTTTRKLHAGQTYDPGYPVPDLAIGHVISGHTVIAATRQIDGPGWLAGLHIVTAYDPANPVTPYVTWEVAWQPSSTQARIAGRPGQWVATGGHYFHASEARDALVDMIHRAGRAPGEDA
jgi:hypothetical protein